MYKGEEWRPTARVPVIAYASLSLEAISRSSSRADDGGPRAWKRNLCTQRELSDEKVAGSTEQYFVGVGGFEDLSEAHPGHLWIGAFATAGHQVERLGRKRDSAGKREVIFNGQTTSVFGQL